MLMTLGMINIGGIIMIYIIGTVSVIASMLIGIISVQQTKSKVIQMTIEQKNYGNLLKNGVDLKR